MWIDVYDFDGTLYHGDSTIHFWFYCLARKPALLRYLPRQGRAVLMLALRRWDLTRTKSEFFAYLTGIDVPAMAEAFWACPATVKRLMPWFCPEDSELPVVIISASPELTLRPLLARWPTVRLIGTQVNPATGQLLGRNCKGTEKVARLAALVPDAQIRAMYTDDLRADAPLLRLAQQRFHVRGRQARRVWQAEPGRARKDKPNLRVHR